MIIILLPSFLKSTVEQKCPRTTRTKRKRKEDVGRIEQERVGGKEERGKRREEIMKGEKVGRRKGGKGERVGEERKVH